LNQRYATSKEVVNAFRTLVGTYVREIDVDGES